MVDIADWPNNLRCELCQHKLLDIKSSIDYYYVCPNSHHFGFGSKSYAHLIKTYKGKNSLVAEKCNIEEKYGNIIDNIVYMRIDTKCLDSELPGGENYFVVCNHYAINGINVNKSVVNIFYVNGKSKSVKFDFRFDIKNLTIDKLKSYLILV